jgi:hypothetical protein
MGRRSPRNVSTLESFPPNVGRRGEVRIPSRHQDETQRHVRVGKKNIKQGITNHANSNNNNTSAPMKNPSSLKYESAPKEAQKFGLVIKESGEVERVALSLKNIQKAVGGYFEIPFGMDKRFGLCVWVNDNGKEECGRNCVATELVRGLAFRLPEGRMLYGPVVIAPAENESDDEEDDGDDSDEEPAWSGPGLTDREYDIIEHCARLLDGSRSDAARKQKVVSSMRQTLSDATLPTCLL